jgi:hypothetical protein
MAGLTQDGMPDFEIAVTERKQGPDELRAIHADLSGRLLAERDLAQLLNELHRLAGVILGRVVVLVELELRRVDALGIRRRQPRGPGDDVGTLGIREIARADDVNELQLAVVLAVQLTAVPGAQVLLVEGVVDVVRHAVLHEGETGVADAHLHVGIGPGTAPFGAERQQDVARLDQSALAHALGEARALRHQQAQADVALRALAVGMLEVDQAVGRLDALRQRETGAGRHGEEHRDLQALRHLLVRLLVVGELLGGDWRRGGQRAGDGEAESQRQQIHGPGHQRNSPHLPCRRGVTTA